MANIRFCLETDDVYWACAYYFCVRNALSKVTNPRFEAFLKTDNPILRNLAREFPRSGNMGSIINVPTTPEEFQVYDEFLSKKQYLETVEAFGIVIEGGVQILTMQCMDLMSGILLKDYGILADSGYDYPAPSSKMTREFEGYDGLVETEELAEGLVSFLQGRGIEEPSILCLEDVEEEKRATACFASYSGAAFKINSPYLVIIRTAYTDFDELSRFYPILMLVVDEAAIDIRFSVSWSAVIPFTLNDTPEVLNNKGKAWEVRSSCDFNHLTYLEKIAQSKDEGK